MTHDEISQSAEWFARGQAVTPGGVNSPVRAFGAVGGTPRFMVSGKGPCVTDADGKEYVDLVGSWGPAILGHAHPAVIESVTHAAAHGLSFGAPSPGEVLLAEEIVSRVDAVEKVRLVSSGTEATMSAIRLARGLSSSPVVTTAMGIPCSPPPDRASPHSRCRIPPELLPQRPETPSSCRTTTSKRCRRHSRNSDRRLPV